MHAALHRSKLGTTTESGPCTKGSGSSRPAPAQPLWQWHQQLAEDARPCCRRQTAMRCQKRVVRVRDEDTPVGFTQQYHTAMTMSQLYAQERPEAIPAAEHEQRRRRRDAAEIVEAARRRGKDEAYVRDRLLQLEALIPDLINLHKLKASDWVVVLADVDAVAAKLIALKTVFPGASAFRVVSSTPRMLLKSTAAVTLEIQQVRTALSRVPNPDAIIEAVPELAEPAALARALATIKSAMPSKDALEVLQKTPEVLYSLGGEADMEDSAEYGELSTKD